MFLFMQILHAIAFLYLQMFCGFQHFLNRDTQKVLLFIVWSDKVVLYNIHIATLFYLTHHCSFILNQ